MEAGRLREAVSGSGQLHVVLTALRKLYFAHWTAHWMSKGKNFYGDHDLFSRLYNGIANEIDSLAEKMVDMYGEDSVRLGAGMRALAMATSDWDESGEDMARRCLEAEREFQQTLKDAYRRLESIGRLTLGLDNFLQGIADKHETHTYLLGRRLTGE